jgi:hypothetical protein
MTMRRQALRSRKPLVTVSFLSLFLSLFFALPSLLANAQDAQPIKVAYVQPGDMTVSPDAESDVPNVDTSVTPTVSSEETSRQAEPTYPLLPLTVIPKPDASPIFSLKAPGAFDQRLVALALLFTILSAVTLVMWRYHRRDYASPRRTGRRI